MIKDVKNRVPDRMKTPLDAILENIQEHDLGDASRTDSSWRRNLPEPVPLSTTFATNSGARKKEYPFGGVLSANPHVYSSNRNLHPRVKVDQAGRPLPPKKT